MPYSSKLFLDLSGYTLSGKSALIQTIKEFEGFSVPELEFEFALFRIKDGIFDLEHSLVNDWSPLRSDSAIRRFIKLVNVLGNGFQKYSPMWLSSPSGYNYDRLVHSKFLAISLDYINSLIEGESTCYWPYALHDIHSIECFIKRVGYAFNKHSVDIDTKYVSFGENFAEKTKLYLNRLFDSHDDIAQIMHNAFEPYRAKDIGRFFDNGKSIIVDRDPRAIFAASKSSRYSDFKDVESFIAFTRQSRMKSKSAMDSECVLTLKLEELVLDYEFTLERIYKFLNVNSNVHIKKGLYFNPYDSGKNINNWKNVLTRNEIELIEKSLSQYCYD